MTALTNIEQRIYAKNFLNEQTLKVLQAIKTEFMNLEGAKVQLSSGEHSKKWTLKSDYIKTDTIINGIKVHLSYQYWFTFSHSTIQLRSKVCISGGSHDVQPRTAFCQYVDGTNYIGKIENQILTDTKDINMSIENVQTEVNNPIDINTFEIQKAEYKQALETLHAINSKVHYSLRDFLPKY